MLATAKRLTTLTENGTLLDDATPLGDGIFQEISSGRRFRLAPDGRRIYLS